MLIEIGKGLTIEVDTDKARNASPDVAARVDRIGFKNILGDAHASAVRSKFDSDKAYRDASLALAQKSLDAMYRGEVRAARTGTTRVVLDPIGKEAARLARVWATPKMDEPATFAKWQTAFGLTERKDVLAEAIKRRAAKPEVIAEATELVAKMKVIVADTDTDL